MIEKIHLFPAGEAFDCCDCGLPMEQAAYHDRIQVGDRFAYRFICEECSKAYRPPSIAEAIQCAREVFAPPTGQDVGANYHGANQAIDYIEQWLKSRGLLS